MTLLNRIYERIAASDPVQGLQELIKDVVSQDADQIETDQLGNVTVTKGKQGRPIKLLCSVPVPRLITTEIPDNGKIRFRSTVPCSADALLHAPVRFSAGGRGIICSDKQEEKLSVKDLYIDTGFLSPEVLQDTVKLYSFSHIEEKSSEQNGAVYGRFLSNFLPMCILLNIIQHLKVSDKCYSFTFLFCTQPSAEAFSYTEIPYLLTLQCAEETDLFSCNSGCGIVLKSKHSVLPPVLKEKIIEIAATRECTYQSVVSHENICALDHLELLYGGALHAGFAIPVRGYHTALETVSEKDIEKTMDLLLKILYDL